MDWFRAHHGISNSNSLRVVAHMSKQPLAFVNAVWLAFLDYASQHEIRGSIDGCDIVEVAVCQGMAIEAGEEIFRVMKERKLIDDNLMLTTWLEKQAKKDDSKERVRRYRERKSAQENGANDPVTGNECNGDVTECNTLPSKIIEEEEEKEREEDTPVSSFITTTTTSASANEKFDFEELTEDERKVVAEIGQDRMGCGVQRLRQWLDAGYDLELDILPAIKRRTKSHPTNRINCLSYFDEVILEQFERRHKPVPEKPDVPVTAPKTPQQRFDEAGIMVKVLKEIANKHDAFGIDAEQERRTINNLSFLEKKNDVIYLGPPGNNPAVCRLLNESFGQKLADAWKQHDATVTAVKVVLTNSI
jgi:hypothetical protein